MSGSGVFAVRDRLRDDLWLADSVPARGALGGAWTASLSKALTWLRKDDADTCARHYGGITIELEPSAVVSMRRAEAEPARIVEVADDPINPAHYKLAPGVEVIAITERLSFCRGNAVKYIARAGRKGDELEDLKKARWYLDRDIARLKRERAEAIGEQLERQTKETP